MDRDAEAPPKRRAVPAGAGLAGMGSGQGTPLPQKRYVPAGRSVPPNRRSPPVRRCPARPDSARACRARPGRCRPARQRGRLPPPPPGHRPRHGRPAALPAGPRRVPSRSPGWPHAAIFLPVPARARAAGHGRCRHRLPDRRWAGSGPRLRHWPPAHGADSPRAGPAVRPDARADAPPDRPPARPAPVRCRAGRAGPPACRRGGH